MINIKKLTGYSAALLIAASFGTAYAEDNLTKTRDQDRVREEVNLQTPASDSGQARYREEKTVRNEDHDQNEYKYMHKYQRGQGGPGTSSMNRSTMSRSTSGGRK